MIASRLKKHNFGFGAVGVCQLTRNEALIPRILNIKTFSRRAAGSSVVSQAESVQAPALASPAAGKAVPVESCDAREIHAKPSMIRFLILSSQLGGLLLVFRLYRLMEKPHFMLMSGVIFGAFLIHYWLPLRFKEAFLATVSLAGAFLLLDPKVASILIAVGLVFFIILYSPVPYKWRIMLLLTIFVALIYGCATKISFIPLALFPVFGAIFMFRIIIYVYDLSHGREKARLLPFLCYFFLLPNYYFTLFPVIDFQTMRRSYYQRDIHEIAQQGIHWMVRGAIQLMLYRLVVYFNDPYLPDRVTNLGALISTMVLTFLLYLNVSGQFHLIVGMLHLFGYDLPETNRRYLMARSFTDFWRRINIYWKDFMVKIVYFPVYFKLRKRGNLRAQVMATASVFLATWILHSYQFFWIKGQLSLGWQDALFWGILGMLVISSVLFESWHKGRRTGSSWHTHLLHAAQVLGTFALITTLWSLWSSPSVNAWIYLMTRWTHGG
jgi:D-alanyl-lipoteichoic acid acyltransferase DltB (MBOAT superfamily)